MDVLGLDLNVFTFRVDDRRSCQGFTSTTGVLVHCALGGLGHDAGSNGC
jgi:hypothetical protein